MAQGSRLELRVLLSRCFSLMLAFAAVASIGGEASLPFRANQLMWCTLCFGGLLWGAALLVFQIVWLCFEFLEPGNVALLALIAVDWAVACLTVGSGCAALAANQYAIHHQYKDCDTGLASVCVWYLAGAAMVCAGGALAAVSALGMLRILRSRFAPAQAP